MGTFPAVTVTNMELTPMMVKFAGVDLGGTLGNVVITAKYDKAPIKADQLGSTILDYRVSGIAITVTTELTEIKNPDVWKVVFPNASLIIGPPKAIQFNTNVGDSDIAHAGLLTLHPLSDTAIGNDYDHTFWCAVASADSTITYGPTEQSRLKIVWNILPDTSVTPYRFYRMGDIASV
jgi:hypothetical protein